MRDLLFLLSEQDRKALFEVGQYTEYIEKGKKFWGEFYSGSLEKAKDSLKEKVKERVDKSYKYEPLVMNYKPEIEERDRQIGQLEQDKKNLEDRLKMNFVIDKTGVKRFGFVLFVVAVLIWTVRFLYQKKCSQC